MRAVSTDEESLVLAARAGDRQALDELATVALPLVYNIVGRALSGHPDVDDIVQDTMVRVLRNLASLRSPRDFRTWVATIAINQVGTFAHRDEVAASRTAGLEEAAGVPDAGADFEDLTILRLGLSGQRRQAVMASRWLDRDDRALLSLWWLETAGQLTRAQLAAALGLSVGHAGVRVQRMLEQLELSRTIVAALAARPGCRGLGTAASGWDGSPSPLWRKRLARHVRDCPICRHAADGLVPTPRLLVGLALVPVPLALTAGLFAKATASAPAVALAASTAGAEVAGAKTGILGQVVHALSAHPVTTAVAGGVLVAGSAAFLLMPAETPTPPAPPPAAAAAPTTTATVMRTSAAPPTSRPPRTRPAPTSAARRSPTAPAIVAVDRGPVSLESADQAGQYVTLVEDLGTLVNVGADPAARQRATFEVVGGLADTRCVSLRLSDGRYLRHVSWRLRPASDDGTVLFREDSTFCPRAGAGSGTVALESFNYPGRFVRHIDEALWVDPSDGTAGFRASGSFRLRRPLAG
ncbi:sigma-70 family RNA polymerase sigma factor [Luedemannella helvata]|uniref:RNA polymerase sigma factor n=1 Tax=Luedemannella helvata TaxID=349315 RepID=A0ABN2JSJ4_9ACTN